MGFTDFILNNKRLADFINLLSSNNFSKKNIKQHLNIFNNLLMNNGKFL